MSKPEKLPGSIPRPCRNHSKEKECQYKTTCWYIHADFSKESASASEQGGSACVDVSNLESASARGGVVRNDAPKSKVCWNEAERKCTFGGNCQYEHVVTKGLFHAIAQFLSGIYPGTDLSELFKLIGRPLSELNRYEDRPILVFKAKGDLKVMWLKELMEQAFADGKIKKEEKARKAEASESSKQ